MGTLKLSIHNDMIYMPGQMELQKKSLILKLDSVF